MTTRIGLTLVAFAVLTTGSLAAQGRTQLAPNLYVYAEREGNVAVFANAEGAFVIGPLSAASTAEISADLGRLTQSPRRYVIAMPHANSATEGDGGWGRAGAFVATHEAAWNRFGEGNAPPAAFSEVLKFGIGSEGVHAVHQMPGHSDADVLVHFEGSRVVYLGELLPGDGYPIIERTGNLDSLVAVLEPWVRSGNQFVPARGPALHAADVRAFRDMLVTMRDRVAAAKRAGQSVEQVVAAHPSAEFDARYGHGRVTADAFVREVFRDAGP